MPFQTWLWSTPAKHSTRQIGEVFDGIEFLRQLGVDHSLTEISDTVLRHYTDCMTARKPSVRSASGRAGAHRQKMHQNHQDRA